MTRAICVSCVILALALMGIATAPGADPPNPEATGDDFADKPTPQHKVLAQDEGTWDASLAIYMEGPDAEPLVSKGVETNTLMTGGLWVLTDFRGEFAGQPFHGRGQTGYDPKKGKYVGTWVDSMTARLTLLEGTYDERAKALTMRCEGVDPATGKATKERHVTQYKGEDARVHAMYIDPEEAGGAPIKVMEISYTRRAK